MHDAQKVTRPEPGSPRSVKRISRLFATNYDDFCHIIMLNLWQ
jgi:hypothetical protein